MRSNLLKRIAGVSDRELQIYNAHAILPFCCCFVAGKVESRVYFDTHANVGNVNNMIKFIQGIATRFGFH
jgi:hypothetical protein